MKNLEIKLHAVNLQSLEYYYAKLIPLNYFDDLKEELEVAELLINGISFEVCCKSYKEISEFLKKLSSYDNQPIKVLAAVVNTPGLVQTLSDVFGFCDDQIIETLVNSNVLTSLRDSVADQWSQDYLSSILSEVPSHLHDGITNYFDHEKYARDLFLNELNYINLDNVEIVHKRKAL